MYSALNGIVNRQVQEAEAPPPPSEFDSLDPATLRKLLLELRSDTEKISKERNQSQIDRVRRHPLETSRWQGGFREQHMTLLQDAVESFYEISKKELREAELATLTKEREIELMSENHRVEVKVRGGASVVNWITTAEMPNCLQVYQQKVKHLEYEHSHGMKKLAIEENGTLKSEDEFHMRWVWIYYE
jgi:hypothetical protein